MATLPSAFPPGAPRPPIFRPPLEMHCSFCGKTTKEEGITLIAGPMVNICNWCVELCVLIIEERKAEKALQTSEGTKTT